MLLLRRWHPHHLVRMHDIAGTTWKEYQRRSWRRSGHRSWRNNISTKRIEGVDSHIITKKLRIDGSIMTLLNKRAIVVDSATSSRLRRSTGFRVTVTVGRTAGPNKGKALIVVKDRLGIALLRTTCTIGHSSSSGRGSLGEFSSWRTVDDHCAIAGRNGCGCCSSGDCCLLLAGLGQWRDLVAWFRGASFLRRGRRVHWIFR